uniref:Uncharacterized protein n=1 Tax=Spongospora subterranea TaxID=70186 RepID=A0A0H5REJ7_9EUKA|eukprot:CRZ12176.1 hypothetical protein [Spongospora subterranea]
MGFGGSSYSRDEFVSSLTDRDQVDEFELCEVEDYVVINDLIVPPPGYYIDRSSLMSAYTAASRQLRAAGKRRRTLPDKNSSPMRSPTNRLYYQDVQHRQQVNERLALENDKEFGRTCTFSPELCPRSRFIQRRMMRIPYRDVFTRLSPS